MDSMSHLMIQVSSGINKSTWLLVSIWALILESESFSWLGIGDDATPQLSSERMDLVVLPGGEEAIVLCRT